MPVSGEGGEMKTCVGCKYAKWARTDAGKLHPSGQGHCEYDYKVPALPSSMYWLASRPPSPDGGYISRREEHKEHCPYFVRAK